MNPLGHAAIAYLTHTSMAGNTLADWIVTRELSKDSALWPGIKMHRRTDDAVDEHLITARSSARLTGMASPHMRRVVVDVAYGYCLARRFDNFAGISLPQFVVNHAHPAIKEELPLLTNNARLIAQQILVEKWLLTYGTEEGLRATLTRLQIRSRRPDLLRNAANEMLRKQQGFMEDFEELWPDLLNKFGVPR